MRWFEHKAQMAIHAEHLNTATLKALYRNRTHQHLGFSAPEMALITLIMSPSKHLVRDDSARWNHPGAEVTAAVGTPGWRFKQGFSSNTINKLIDARRCEAIRWNGKGSPVEVRFLPL